MTIVLSQKLLSKVGNTPLIELQSFSNSRVKIYAKLEWFNPFGSIKDRPAYWMLTDAKNKGLLTKDRSIIIEPTSGNTGIALTGISKLLGYKIEIVIPSKVSEETKRILRGLGAELHETTDDLCPRVGVGTDQSISLATAIARARPDTYYMPNQYENDVNFRAHYEGTGVEIWNDSENNVTHFIAGGGTGGTLTGVGTYLKEKNPNIKIIAVQPQKNHLIQGLRNYEESSMPLLFKRRAHVIDDWYTITNKESFDTVREIYEKEGLLVGPSSGCVLAAAKKLASSIKEGYIVTIFADDGRKFKSLYVEQNIFNEKEYEDALNKARLLSQLPF